MEGIEMEEVSVLSSGGDGQYVLQRLHFLVSGWERFNLRPALGQC